MAYSSITMNASSTLEGRAMAEVGAVTYNGNGGTLPAPAAPIFIRISKTPTNSVTLLSTTPYFPVTLQMSTNLLHGWTSIATNTPVSSPWIFTNKAPLTATRAYFQAFITPYP